MKLAFRGCISSPMGPTPQNSLIKIELPHSVDKKQISLIIYEYNQLLIIIEANMDGTKKTVS